MDNNEDKKAAPKNLSQANKDATKLDENDFEQVAGGNLDENQLDQVAGGKLLKKLPGKRTPPTVTLKRGFIKDFDQGN